MRCAKTVEVGLVAVVLLTLLPMACHAGIHRMLPTGAGIGSGDRTPRASAAVAVPLAAGPSRSSLITQAAATQVPPHAPSILQDAIRRALPTGSPIPQGAAHYTVQRGDGLWRIAMHFGLSVDTLARRERI